MLVELKNSDLLVKADSVGAELKSIKKVNDKSDIEYLWQLNPDVWERQAPLLFPIIGRLKDDEYTHNCQTYKTGIHGFARFKEFKIEMVSEEEVNFILEYNRDTLKEYPFKFRLTVNYKLSENSIVKSHITENLGSGAMLYEVGGHEGYNLSLFENEKMEDYYMEFGGMEKLQTYTADSDIMMNEEKIDVGLENSRIFMSPEVFKKDALIMDEFAANKVMLRNTKNNRGIDVEFADFKYLGIWTKYMRTNYVCIEPWTSLPDGNYIGKELSEKQDIRTVEEGEKEKLTYTITVI